MRRPASALLALVILSLAGCDHFRFEGAPEPTPAPVAVDPPAPEADAPPARVDARPPPMTQPVPLYEGGTTEREVDAATAAEHGYVLLDLGESWTPYIFTEQANPEEARVEHAYRETYLALARGEHPDDQHGDRAERDKYLELFGIMPTLGLIRERFRQVGALACRESLDLSPIETFDGFIRYENNRAARQSAAQFVSLERQVASSVETQGVESETELDEERLDDRQRRALGEYRAARPRVAAIRAAQARLECEGYFEGKGDHVDGGLDWATHEALAEFERRHRVYGWGFIGNDTLERLRQAPLELERDAVVRVLTERAVHSMGVLEDGSAPSRNDEPPTYVGRDGAPHEIPNLEEQIRVAIVEALGLSTPESTLEFLESLGELGPGEERLVAFDAPRLPAYYSGDMDIRIEIDRGDVWYEFPYDEEGNERGQPVQRRPRQTVIVRWNDQDIRVARYGTTIGGWRSEQVDGRMVWRYKNSPVGDRVWSQIVSAPVWMPPESTPARDLVHRVPGRSGQDAYRINYHETGPSYASAYGLVAAYHRTHTEEEDGSIRLRGDEGIRSHGSVDYMSIMRRHSHGCHRLHNHIAVRLMSWVLAHRPHRRVGHQLTAFHRLIEHEGFNYELDIERGGYVFELEHPLRVRVLEGRIRGTRATPIEEPLPRYDAEIGAYVTSEGQTVAVSRTGVVTPIVLPGADLPDGGLPEPMAIVNPFE